jgi:hypothetical protein
MPEITTITSESLQAEVRRLLPSQRGFGQDLEAQNVIVPIVDLTPTAEGSALREDLQTAVSFGAITAASRIGVATGFTNIVNTPGFYKYNVSMNVASSGTADTFNARLEIGSSGTTKIIHRISNVVSASGGFDFESFTGIVFLDTGETLKIANKGTGTTISCSAWQIADSNGNFVNPSGFSFE